MKYKTRDLVIIIFLLVVGALATFVFRTNYSSRKGNDKLPKLTVSEFTQLFNSPQKKVWFYIYNKHEIKYSGILADDRVKHIFISQNGKARLYEETGVTPVYISDFNGLSPLAMVQRIEGNMISGHDFAQVGPEYDFKALPDSSGKNVEISITAVNGLRTPSTFVQTVPNTELVNDVRVETLSFAGYLHQSASTDRFLKYQSVGLITPIEPIINNTPLEGTP